MFFCVYPYFADFYPYVFFHVSLCIFFRYCIFFIYQCICPYVFLHLSLYLACVYPYVFLHLSLCNFPGTDAWVKYMTVNLPSASFEHLCTYPKLFRAWVKVQQMRGDSLGRPRVDAFGPPHTLTWAKYEVGNRKERPDMRSPRTVAPHSYLPFLRGVSHNYAINATHNAGHYPVRVSGTDPDNVGGKEFTTFNKAVYCYYVNYCFSEGLQRTSKLASEVLLYLFHSKPEYKGKPSSVIRILHRCLQSGTYRFPEPETLFEDALQILRTVPAATSWLTDKVCYPQCASVPMFFCVYPYFADFYPYVFLRLSLRFFPCVLM